MVVENAELRRQLRAAGYDQPQITDASHFIVVASEKQVDTALVEKYMHSVASVKNIPVANLAGLSSMINGTITSKGEAGAREWAARQAYIAVGFLVAAAAIEGIDAAPMEGFDPQQFDEILGLDKRGLTSRVMVALGFRKDDDPAAAAVKVRYSEDEVFTTL